MGKTLQTISFISYLTYERKVAGPSLVVVPLSVVSSWMLELSRWAPQLRVVRFHTNDVEERKRLRQEVRCRPRGRGLFSYRPQSALYGKTGLGLRAAMTPIQWRRCVSTALCYRHCGFIWGLVMHRFHFQSPFCTATCNVAVPVPCQPGGCVLNSASAGRTNIPRKWR